MSIFRVVTSTTSGLIALTFGAVAATVLAVGVGLHSVQVNARTLLFGVLLTPWLGPKLTLLLIAAGWIRWDATHPRDADGLPTGELKGPEAMMPASCATESTSPFLTPIHVTTPMKRGLISMRSRLMM